MAFNLQNYSFTKLMRMGMGALVTMALVACGGGGGSPGATGGVGAGSGGSSGGSSAGNGTIQVTLTDAAGAVKNSVTSGNPLIAKARVTNDTGTPLSNKLVTFTLTGTIATLSPVSGTALTDANGIAQINIQSAGIGGGADEITASVTIGTAAVTAKAAFSVGAAPTATASAINFVTAVPKDKSIVIKGAGGNGRTEVALLTFSLVDSSNSGVANQPVTFSTQSSKAVSLTATTGTTGADGQVTVALNSGTEPTTVRVIATVTGTAISAMSDTVTVTTGQPAQAAFSLSQEKFYVEGLNFDNIQNKITVLLADSFGGAVADGTQVVFTTDSGAIVGTGGAACLTVQGACTVTWRSQNPRSTNGLATVIATATNATTNLSAQTNFYYSGSYGIVYGISAASQAGSTTRVTSGGPIGLSFSANCSPQSFNIEVTDVNGNPMPEGTAITAVNGLSASAVISPASVANTGLRLGSSTRGTIHSVTVTPASCDLTGTKPVNGAIDLSVKTPLGGETFTRISLGTFLTK